MKRSVVRKLPDEVDGDFSIAHGANIGERGFPSKPSIGGIARVAQALCRGQIFSTAYWVRRRAKESARDHGTTDYGNPDVL
jgi:hypothetical protein